MNWNDQRSIVLTKLCIGLFTLGYFAVLILAPALVDYVIAVSWYVKPEMAPWFMMTVYGCAFPLGVILYQLYRLVASIGAAEIFTEKNIKRLRLISWMCFGVAMICLLSACYYLLFWIVGAAMAFIGLLIRVIKNVFVRAAQLQEECDYTI